jgi:hypothetical protein
MYDTNMFAIGNARGRWSRVGIIEYQIKRVNGIGTKFEDNRIENGKQLIWKRSL